MQNHYSVLYREEEREMMPTLKVILCITILTLNSLTVELMHTALWCWFDTMEPPRSWCRRSSTHEENSSRREGPVSLTQVAILMRSFKLQQLTFTLGGLGGVPRLSTSLRLPAVVTSFLGQFYFRAISVVT